MTTENLDRILQPRSVAVVGASARPGSVGAVVMENLMAGGFKGDLFPVNPKYPSVSGIPALADAGSIPLETDLVVVAVPMASVPEVLETCARRKVGGAVLISAGKFGIGPWEDDGAYERIRSIAARSGMRIIGPDSVGLINTLSGLNASFMHQTPPPGNIAFLSQSGAMCTSVLDLAMRENVGFSHFISLGSKLDVNFSDMLDFLGSQPEVESIVMYVESLVHMRRFMSAARAVSRVKPIIALKSGRSGTAGDLCEDEIYDAAFKRAGILRVDEFEALFDCAEFLAKQERPNGPRLAIVSNATGIGAMAKDALAARGLSPASLDPETVRRLDGLLGDTWSRSNPIALIRSSTPENYIRVVETCIDAAEIDGLLLLSSPVGTYDCTSIARSLADLLQTTPFPVLTAWLGGINIDQSRSIFNRSGIVTYDTPERAVRAFVNLYQYGRNLELLQEIPYTTDKRLTIDRPRAARIIEQGLARHGDRLTPVAAGDLMGAYGIEMASPERGGTSDDGGSGRLDLSLRISAVNNDLFGPVIRFGAGGLMTEVSRDTSMALPPLNRLLARRAIEATRISGILHGHGHLKLADLSLLEEMMILVSRMVTDYPVISRLDLNPIQVRSGRFRVCGVNVALRESAVTSPAHLIISPYPWWQESEFMTRDGERIFMRPVRPGDAQQMIDLFYDLSEETVYLRFFSPLKRLSRSLLIKLTQIDYDREIALCAFAGRGKHRKIIGVSRIIFFPDGKTGEFAVVLADAWHGKGIGSVLLRRALESAKKYGLTHISGPVMTSNTAMLTMGQKLGFTIALDPASSEYRLTLALADMAPDPRAGRQEAGVKGPD